MKLINIFFFSLIIAISSCNSQQTGVLLDAETFNKKINETENAVLLDVRTAGEYSKGFILNAKNADYYSSDFQNKLKNIEKDNPVFVYCLSGSRSASVVKQMLSDGFTEVYELKGGLLNWRKNNLPLSKQIVQDTKEKYTLEDYNKFIASGEKVLIDFNAPWCLPCKKMEPMLDEISSKYSGKVKVIRINIDENKQLAEKLGVQEIPFIKIYKNGSETWSHQGFRELPEIEKNL